MGNVVHLTVVSPVYCAENIVKELVRKIKDTVLLITEDFEIILVNDYSPDNSWQRIEEECFLDSRVKGINLSRNFGQHNAITAGLCHSKGEWIVVMDCDLQDNPEEIQNLYTKAQEGYEIVIAKRIKRTDSIFKKLFSRWFYALFSYLTETKQDSSVANFGIYNRKVIESVLMMKDVIRFFPTQIQWVGFRKYYLPVKHGERLDGHSSYNFKSLFNLAFNTIVAFSDKPLRLFVKIGFIISIVSFCVGVYFLVRYFMGSVKVLGFASIIVSIWFLGGIIIFLCGIIGIYLGKTFEKVKDRPNFIITQKINLD